MNLGENGLILSATDIVNFLECEHLTQLNLAAAHGELLPPPDNDPEATVLRDRGLEHERRYLAYLKAQGKQVVEISSTKDDPRPRLIQEQERTLRALRDGAEVIYQAAFFDGEWLRHADFLLRVDTPSTLGDFSYEVADTKLARRVKAGALIQMCAYSEWLAAIQGRVPEHVHVVLGTMTVDTQRLADFSAYYRAVKERFLAAVRDRGRDTYPDPVSHCHYCRWSERCEARRRADDHLSLVAGLSRSQTRKLAQSGVPTLAVLAGSHNLESVKGIGDHTLRKLRHQAQLQLRQRETQRVHFDVLPPEGPERGLCALPAPDLGDLFFDMEGDPWEG
ncbi:MAG: TM0106 family RecB-like putative nuclease, partial [Chloroflexi bacterium]|nr:TM0106 family RecB-like putative nuclease [Chloroflexota bacterium]